MFYAQRFKFLIVLALSLVLISANTAKAQENKDGSPVEWIEHVSDENYDG